MSARKLRPKAPSRHPAPERERRRALAAADRDALTEDADLIDWDAPAFVEAFAHVCDAVDWAALTIPAFRDAAEQLRDPVRGTWSPGQLDLASAIAVRAAMTIQLNPPRLAALAARLDAVLAQHWDLGVRAGVEFLLELVRDVQAERAERQP